MRIGHGIPSLNSFFIEFFTVFGELSRINYCPQFSACNTNSKDNSFIVIVPLNDSSTIRNKLQQLQTVCHTNISDICSANFVNVKENKFSNKIIVIELQTIFEHH